MNIFVAEYIILGIALAYAGLQTLKSAIPREKKGGPVKTGTALSRRE